MSLLAEEVVEEWLNRQGYFTIRGIKIGNNEIDLLAIRIAENDEIECRHIEVHASFKPMGFITRSGARQSYSEDELKTSVQQWVEKKYGNVNMKRVVAALRLPEPKRGLVLHLARFPEEIALIKEHGIQVHSLKTIVEELRDPKKFILNTASGTNLLQLMLGIADAEIEVKVEASLTSDESI